jgi:hypothetical protein
MIIKGDRRARDIFHSIHILDSGRLKAGYDGYKRDAERGIVYA